MIQHLIGLDSDKYSAIFSGVPDLYHTYSMREAIAEDLPKYLSSEYNDFEILDEADTTSVDQGKSVNFNRRKTLFNLYAVTYRDTWQKDRNGLEGNQSIGNYSIPTLLL